MADEKLLTIRDVSLILGISEKEVIALAESQVIPAYKIGGIYLRFRRHHIEEYKRKIKPHARKNKPVQKTSTIDKARDFLYFNDFYILSGVIIVLLFILIVRG